MTWFPAVILAVLVAMAAFPVEPGVTGHEKALSVADLLVLNKDVAPMKLLLVSIMSMALVRPATVNMDKLHIASTNVSHRIMSTTTKINAMDLRHIL